MLSDIKAFWEQGDDAVVVDANKLYLRRAVMTVRAYMYKLRTVGWLDAERGLYLYCVDTHTDECVRLSTAPKYNSENMMKELRRDRTFLNDMKRRVESFATGHFIALDMWIKLGSDFDTTYVFHIYPKHVIDLVASKRGWSVDKVPVKMKRRLQNLPKFVERYDRTNPTLWFFGVAYMDVFTFVYIAKSCAMCGKCNGPLRKCGKCNAVKYCSKECQVHDWTHRHRDVCDLLTSSGLRQGTSISSDPGEWALFYRVR